MVTVTAGMVAVVSILSAAAQSASGASRSFDSASVDPSGEVAVMVTTTYYG